MKARKSVASGGSQGKYYSHAGGISADGRFVAFTSAANNLVAGDTNDRIDVFVHDRQTGVTERVSVDSFGAQGNGNNGRPAIGPCPLDRIIGRFCHFSTLS